MKLVDALNILKSPLPEEVPARSIALVCGFTPAHLQTYLGAHLRQLDPSRGTTILTGLYGDCLGNLERLSSSEVDASAVVIEWPDLDPRLGLRHLGGWKANTLADILETAASRAAHFSEAIVRLAKQLPLAVCLPTLPIPPVAYFPCRQSSAFDLKLREVAISLASKIVHAPGVRVVNPQRLDELSPTRDRLDVRSELSSGFPYRLSHASAVAELLASSLQSPMAKKGLITDLDGTLWRGIVGDVGIDGISWDLDHRSHIHGLYQQMLASLADAGVLIAVASKNDPLVVNQVFERSDLILDKRNVFPMEVGWGPKSESVRRILSAWNVGADSVVFIDDSPMELAEVAAAYPDVEGLLFPKDNDQAAYELIQRLRDLFGKDKVSEEDAIRLESLRRSAESFGGEEVQAGPPDSFLEQAEAELSFNTTKTPPNPRALELINKTNQFNLNGRRYTEGEWLAHLRSPEAFLLLVSYKDKYGPLGTIAVLTGHSSGNTVTIDQWVMSCRAFSRRIEHQCLSVLFESFGVDQLVFDFRETPRNGPLRSFFTEFTETSPEPGLRITRRLFQTKCPPLYHKVKGPDAWLIPDPA